MSKSIRSAAGLVVAALLTAPLALAQEGAAAPTADDGLRASALNLFDRTAGHVVELAEAMPAEKYDWRPAEGVRSVGEVFLHIVGANYFLSGQLGLAAENAPKLDTISGKAQVVEALKASIAHARKAIEGTAGQDLDRRFELFGSEMTARTVVLILGAHLNEHLGQAIAYARMNGVTPPWSAKSEG